MDELYNLFGGSEQLWQNIKMYAIKTGRESTRIVLELYYVVKSPNTPALDKALIIAALGYQLLPDDLMTRDKYGWLGVLDNGAALALAYNRVKARVTPQIKSQVSAVLEQWFGSDQSQENIIGNTDNKDVEDVSTPSSTSRLDSSKTAMYTNNSDEGYDDNEDVVID